MNRRKTLRQLRSFIERKTASGDLEPGQQKAIELAVKKVDRAIQQRDMKMLELAIGRLVRVFIGS